MAQLCFGIAHAILAAGPVVCWVLGQLGALGIALWALWKWMEHDRG